MYADQSLVLRFEADRAHLRAVAYRLLGSIHDAEDAIQAAWLKISAANRDNVENLTGWFTTVTARQCLDHLRARNRRHEVALADDPEVNAQVSSGVDEEVALADSVGRALLVVLESPHPRPASRFCAA